MSRRQYISTKAFVDLLFNCVLGITTLFIVAYLLIAPPGEKNINDIKSQVKLMITMNWPDGNPDDVDLWVKGPNDKIIGHPMKDKALFHLDRDDRGEYGDTIIGPDGEPFTNPRNNENVFIREWLPGNWTVNVHMYAMRQKTPTPVVLELIKIHPYKILTSTTVTMNYSGEEVTAFNFKIVELGNGTFTVTNINDHQQKFIIDTSGH